MAYVKVAFLIEGSRSNPQYQYECIDPNPIMTWLLPNEHSRQILRAEAIAQYSQEKLIFDPIKSRCAVLYWKEFLKAIPTHTHKIIILWELYSRGVDYPRQLGETSDAIGQISPPINQAYRELFQKLPNWLNDIDNSKLIKEIDALGGVKNLEHTMAMFTLAYRKLDLKYFVELSNRLSRETVFEYLSKNQNIEVIYGLVGKLHLHLLDANANVVCEGNLFRFLELPQIDHNVYFYLFGGSHASDEPVRFFEAMIKRHGLPTSYFDVVSNFVYKEDTATHQNQLSLMQESCVYAEQASKIFHDIPLPAEEL